MIEVAICCTPTIAVVSVKVGYVIGRSVMPGMIDGSSKNQELPSIPMEPGMVALSKIHQKDLRRLQG